MLLVLKDQQQLECQCSKLLLEPPPLLKMLRPHQRPSGRQPGSDLQSSHVTRHCFLNTLFTLFFPLLLLVASGRWSSTRSSHLRPVTAGRRSFPLCHLLPQPAVVRLAVSAFFFPLLLLPFGCHKRSEVRQRSVCYQSFAGANEQRVLTIQVT